MEYAEAIEYHKQHTIRHLSRHFGVNMEHVKFVGELPPIWRPHVLCDHASNAVLEVFDGPEMFPVRPPEIELAIVFESVDNILFRKMFVLAGQCPDCGKVLFTERDRKG